MTDQGQQRNKRSESESSSSAAKRQPNVRTQNVQATRNTQTPRSQNSSVQEPPKPCSQHSQAARNAQTSRNQTTSAQETPKARSQHSPTTRDAQTPRSQNIQATREKVREQANQPVLIFGRTVYKDTLFRLGGLAVFFVFVVILVVMLWPYMGQFFEPGGRERMMEQFRNAGPLGVVMLLGIQVLQVVVAFIPGEVVQVAAGAMYGPFGGMVIILAGCVLASWFIYEVVHRLGQPFVEAMVPTHYLERFRSFEANGKLTPLVFVLFLIPGLPKDTFTYLVPLTNMPLKKYLLITTIARIPGVFMSTFAASGFVDGNMRQAIVAVVVLAILAGIGVLFKDRIISLLGR